MTFFPPHLTQLAEEVLAAARAKKLRLATAESCTGGLIAGCLTEIAGSSDVVDRGFIVYSNEAKVQMLGVSQKTLAAVGAVSADTAGEMAYGTLANSSADIAVSVTGIAGPGGGSAEKPVGLVYMGVASAGIVRTVRNIFPGDRTAVRLQTVEAALKALLEEISSS